MRNDNQEMTRLEQLQEQRAQELLDKSEGVMNDAISLIARLDGTSEEYVREMLDAKLEAQGFTVDDGAGVSFGKSNEQRIKENELISAVENGYTIAAENRARELKEMKEKEKKIKEEKEKKDQKK